MRRRQLVMLTAALLLFVLPAVAQASGKVDGDTDTCMVDAKVVEVTEFRISVIARTGVEHVIAINDTGTTVMMNGKPVALKDLRKGDVVTVELDELNPLKFAKHITIAAESDSELATVVP